MSHPAEPAVVVGAVIVGAHRKVLLARFPKWGNKWAIPGGKVRHGERLFEALQREIYEETALMIHDASILRVGESIHDPSFRDGSWHLVFVDFIARSFQGDVRLDQRELTDHQWVTPNEALSLDLTPPTKEALASFLATQESRQ